MELIRPYLDAYYEANWTNRTLEQEIDRIEMLLLVDYPNLNKITARALANRWGYNWT